MSGRLEFHAVDASRWADFEAFFESRGAPKHCWCMVWRTSAEERKRGKGSERKEMMRARIMAGTPVGLLAYRDGAPVAWVSVAPRTTHRRMGGIDIAGERPDDVWSLTCFFIRRDLRGQGMTRRLIAAALDHARDQGATVLEAYPIDPDAPSYRFMGFVPTFEQAGFRDCGMAGTRRHVMRKALA